MTATVCFLLSFLIAASAWALNRTRTVIQPDRVGAAGFVVGFVYGHHQIVGPGWDTTRPASWLPLIAVAAALVGPRLAARLGEVPVGMVPRITILSAIILICVACALRGAHAAAELELAVLAAAVGTLTSGFLGRATRDVRVGTWTVITVVTGLIPALAA